VAEISDVGLVCAGTALEMWQLAVPACTMRNGIGDQSARNNEGARNPRTRDAARNGENVYERVRDSL